MPLLQKKSDVVFYSGKVRDTYVSKDRIFIVVTDRISAFDHILPREIPYKGAVLNGISTFFLTQTQGIVPNWLLDKPNSHVSFGLYAPTIPLEVIVRGYIAGSMWRAYENGERDFCGNILPEGLVENQKLSQPIITPTSKAKEGHDENISEKELLQNKIVSIEEWALMKDYAFKLFEFGQQYANTKDLILVDTKFEFGKKENGEIILIDEILTPDSSRYFLKSSYDETMKSGREPQQLSKEFVRQWLISQGFMGREGDEMPEMTDDVVQNISDKYIELYNKLIEPKFVKEDNQYNETEIQSLFNQLM